MADISGFGLRVNLIANVTYPVGIAISQFADDADPLDFGAVKVGDVAMGLNGDLITWAQAVPLPMVLNVIPDSEDDVSLSVLANAVRVSKGKTSSQDVITATVIYPNGKVITLTGGKLTDAQFGNSVSTGGRIKTKSYAFMFENKSGV